MNTFHRWYCDTGRWRHTVQDQIVPWVLKGIELGPHVLEIGPGPGLTTDVLAQKVEHLDAVEVDPVMAERLGKRTIGTNVEVLTADATQLSFADATFSAAVCFTMLHHVPSTVLQDRLVAEAFRVLQPGGVFAGSDSTVTLVFRAAHLFDTMVLVDPAEFGSRLELAGFKGVSVERAKGAFKFKGRKPD